MSIQSKNSNESILKERKSVVFLGHVDHGKSTLIGRILFDKNIVDQGKIEIVKNLCLEQKKDFEYAYLLDALVEEREKNVTIDVARCFAKIDENEFLFIDAPGHLEFLKNMLTGSSQADLAVLVLDVGNGVESNTHCHLQALSFLGVKEIIVCINKMDTVNYREEEFLKVKDECNRVVEKLDLTIKKYVPISAKEGKNITSPSKELSWYTDLPILEELANFQQKIEPNIEPFRMYVQDVYNTERVEKDIAQQVVGKVASGTLGARESLLFYPAKKDCTVLELKTASGESLATRGDSINLHIKCENQLKRGDLLCKPNEVLPSTGNKLVAKIFYLGETLLSVGSFCKVRIGTNNIKAELLFVGNVFDLTTQLSISVSNELSKYYIAECHFQLEREVGYDVVAESSRNIVMMLDHRIVAAGKINK